MIFVLKGERSEGRGYYAKVVNYSCNNELLLLLLYVQSVLMKLRGRFLSASIELLIKKGYFAVC